MHLAFPHSCYMSRWSNYPWFDHSSNLWRRVQITKQLVMQWVQTFASAGCSRTGRETKCHTHAEQRVTSQFYVIQSWDGKTDVAPHCYQDRKTDFIILLNQVTEFYWSPCRSDTSSAVDSSELRNQPSGHLVFLQQTSQDCQNKLLQIILRALIVRNMCEFSDTHLFLNRIRVARRQCCQRKPQPTLHTFYLAQNIPGGVTSSSESYWVLFWTYDGRCRCLLEAWVPSDKF
jgi:hypothetical protein